MKVADLYAALDLPAGARVDQRVPKKLLVENGAPTSGDKRRINEGIEEVQWLAALKPTTVGIPEFRDPMREYLEIAILSVALRPGAQSGRLSELVHRAVPYPVVLLSSQGEALGLSLAHKRWSQGEAGATVLDGALISADLGEGLNSQLWRAFGDALPMAQQPGTDLFALYQGWMDTVVALLAGRLTGSFTTPESPEKAEARRAALAECARLEAQMAGLRASAAKESQVARQVELNLELKRLESTRAAALAKL